MRWLFARSTGEIMVLLVAFTVCAAVAVGGTAIIVLAFVYPDWSGSGAASRTIADLLTTLVGLLAGFLAGRTDSAVAKDAQTARTVDNTEPMEPPRR